MRPSLFLLTPPVETRGFFNVFLLRSYFLILFVGCLGGGDVNVPWKRYVT